MSEAPNQEPGRNRDGRDLAGTALGLLLLTLLIVGSLWILRPFLGALLWAVMIVVATWPVLLRVQRRLFGRRVLAVAVMTLALLLVLVLPVTMLIGTLMSHTDTLVSWAGSLSGFHLPPPPEWLQRLPLVGEQAAGAWQHFSELSNRELLDRAAPYVGTAMTWILEKLGGLGFVVLEFLLTVIVAGIVYAHAEEAGGFVLRFARRIAGDQGEQAARLAAQAVRGVALGVVGTALIQSALAGIGLAIAGVPFAGLLTAVAFMLTVAQIGVLFVLLPALVWLYGSGAGTGLVIFLLAWTLVVSTMDNFLRPLLIKKGADLSLVLIFAGVIGGLLTFGIIGIFVGPVLLAVSWTLLSAWVGAGDASGDGPR